MAYNYMKNRQLPKNVQGILQNKAKSEECRDDAERIMINADKEKCEKVKLLLSEGYVVKDQTIEGFQCIFELEKDRLTETIKIRFSDNINEIKKLLNT